MLNVLNKLYTKCVVHIPCAATLQVSPTHLTLSYLSASTEPISQTAAGSDVKLTTHQCAYDPSTVKQLKDKPPMESGKQRSKG